MIDYDVIIVGAGPAGMNAALYASRANLKTLVIEKNYPGGKIVKANKVENWLGIQSIEGADLALQMFKHSFSFGAVYEQGNVLDVVDYKNHKEVVLENKKYKCLSVIICTGMSERKIGIPGEEDFYGKGVSYCAVCDAALYKNQLMVVIGNSDYAIEESLYLSKFASKVLLVNEKKELLINEILKKKIDMVENIEVNNGWKLVSINGKDSVESITIEFNGEKRNIQTNVVFPLIGSTPDSMFISRLKITDDKNYIKVNEKQETVVKGIYAAGDCTNNSLKQIVTASSGGAVAAMESYKYIEIIKKGK